MSQSKPTKLDGRAVLFAVAELLVVFVVPFVQYCPKPDNPVDCGWVNWATRSLAMTSRQSYLLKRETWNGQNDKYFYKN